MSNPPLLCPIATTRFFFVSSHIFSISSAIVFAFSLTVPSEFNLDISHSTPRIVRNVLPRTGRVIPGIRCPHKPGTSKTQKDSSSWSANNALTFARSGSGSPSWGWCCRRRNRNRRCSRPLQNADAHPSPENLFSSRNHPVNALEGFVFVFLASSATRFKRFSTSSRNIVVVVQAPPIPTSSSARRRVIGDVVVIAFIFPHQVLFHVQSDQPFDALNSRISPVRLPPPPPGRCSRRLCFRLALLSRGEKKNAATQTAHGRHDV